MYAFKLSTLAVLATMCTSAFATPAPLEARDDTANVRMFSGDTCGGAEQSFSVAGSGSYRCVPVSAARRSVIVTGSEKMTPKTATIAISAPLLMPGLGDAPGDGEGEGVGVYE
ncbi:hypothetical protein BJX68DRAFT_267297 [Aspergillus pseudodeflectus]|uniref:Uncharacterized protein n=1 Tax=Aspergillus pseudodeflectus TaxID=176178 RepID=A0ABR4KAW5_9EURO